MRKLTLLLLAVVLLATQAMAQRTVTGKVTDEKGNPLANVSVLVRGTTVGTITKADGTYSLAIPANARALVFSAVDMSPVELAVGTATEINATLKAEDRTMSEVVVTALGIKKDKKTLGYGVTQLSAQQLTQAHTTNITNALAGKVPGVRIQGSGGSFAGSSIIIRGYTTFTGSNQPLFVVDGIPIDNSGGGNNLQTGPTNSNRAIDLNQEDIESISVLKGPSAAVLYGSRGSNGVIIITTKKGKSGQKASITYSTSYQVETVNRFPEYQNEYAQGTGGVFWGGVLNGSTVLTESSWGPRITGQTVTTAYNPLTKLNNRTEILAAYPNNVRDIFRNGFNWQNNISFQGGSDKNTFRFSYGYLKNAGVLQNNLLNRHNFSLNTSSKVNNYLTITASGIYTINSSRRTQQGNQLSNPLFRGWFIPRSYDLTNLPWEDVLGNQTYLNTLSSAADNPYWTIKNNRFNDEINRFIGSVSLNFKITKWLQGDYKIGTDVFSTFRHGYDQIGARGQANTAAGGVGGIVENRNNFRSLNSNAFLTAQKRFKNFSGSAVIGTDFNQTYNTTATLNGKGVIVRDFEQLINTITFSPSPATGATKVRLFSIYGDFTVSYRSIFSLNATLRNDWSSTFKPGNNSYLYHGFGGSVNFSELIPSLKGRIVDNIKIRANVAKVGKAGTDFAYGTDTYFAGAGVADGFGPGVTFPFNGIGGYALSNGIGVPELGPEFTTNREIAGDFSFFKGRLDMEATYYWSKSTKLIFSVPVSAASGITSVTKNAGNLSTKGFEFGLNATPLKSRSFSWDLNLTYTQFKSMVDKLEPGVTNIFLGGFVNPNIRLVAGDEYGQIYGTAYVRDQKGGLSLIGPSNTTNQSLWGLPQRTLDIVKIGNPNPKWIGGMTNTFTYKALSLSVLMEYKKGGQIYSRNVADLQRNGVAKETAEFPRYDANGVLQKPYLFNGTVGGAPNTYYVSAEQYWGNNGIFVADEGFIFGTTWFRVREASATYMLPSSLLSRTPFSVAELSIFGRNLFLDAPDYPHLDPEQSVLGISNAQGLEFNALPQTRSMGAALKLTF